jgi:mono/diheme cytochrome c family protein
MNLIKITSANMLIFLLLFAGCKKADTPSPQNTSSAGSVSQTKFIQEIKLGNVDKEMAEKGKKVFESKCMVCHKWEERYTGPALKGVTKRRKPEWIMNMILFPDAMVKEDETAKQLLVEYMLPMANQNVTQEEARNILEYIRVQDSEK